MDPLTVNTTDPLTDLLNSLRTTSAVFNRSSMSGKWAVRFEDGSPLALTVSLHTSMVVIPCDGEPVQLAPYDVAILSGGGPYLIASDVAAEPDVLVGTGGLCTTLSGESTGTDFLADAGGAGNTVLLNGLYTIDGVGSHHLLAALPRIAVARAGDAACPVTAEGLEDLIRPRPGHKVLLDRTLDLMLLTALRAWFIRPGAPIPAWYRAHSDPVVGHALQLLDASPSFPWTVDNLAAKTGVSRAALARRFTELVGLPPMTYVREKRLDIAADLLSDTDATIGAVASRVGFSSAFAFSAAFKKVRGITPSQHRRQATTTTDS